MPITWDELDDVEGGSHWTVANAVDHLRKRKSDPWRGYWRARQKIQPAVQRRFLARPA